MKYQNYITIQKRGTIVKMAKFKYIEMIEEDYDAQTEIPNMIRLDVSSDEEAESLYAQHKDKFKVPKGKVIEGEHFADSKLNKPCTSRKIKEDGKLETEQ